jgi:hypothetical protein
LVIVANYYSGGWLPKAKSKECKRKNECVFLFEVFLLSSKEGSRNKPWGFCRVIILEGKYYIFYGYCTMWEI